MEIIFDKNRQPEKPKIYLGTSNNKVICELNGIAEDTFQITHKVNDTWEISFDVDRYFSVDGVEVESNSYSLLCFLMRIYVDGVGWFIIDQPPSQSNDGIKEKKSITALSAQIEFHQHTIPNLKINKGTTDSYEMLIPDNVNLIGEVEFAKKQIVFHDKDNPEFSLLEILLDICGVHGWSVGYIDTIPHIYRTYDNGEYVETQVMLEDEIGSFDISGHTLYSFLTQEAAKYFNCIFEFDFKNFKINAYRPENYGKDTNINIGFRNLQQSNEITCDESTIFNRYTVQGSDNLGITYANFGTNVIEDLSHFLNEKYMTPTLVEKYRLWTEDVEIYRKQYIEQTRIINQQQLIISELTNRQPLDDCSTDWSTFTDAELLEAQANYKAQIAGYEQFYVDDNGDFDQNALDASSDADDYYQIKDVILPSIQIEIDNRNLPDTTDPDSYIDTYKTDWKLYGLDELQVNITIYKNNKKLAEDEECTEPYNVETSGHTEDYHTKLYEQYLEAIRQLDETYIGSCAEAFAERQAEIDSAKAIQESATALRKQIVSSVEKETWKHETSENSGEYYTFTDDDLSCLSKLYIDGDYSNENMFLVSSDDAVTSIDEQLKLLDAAKEDLSIACRPQYKYTTSLDNFLAMYEYENYTHNLNIGDFIWLGVRDDYVVKLRVISIAYNPLCMNNDLQITFSDMLESASDRDDFYYMLNSTVGGTRNTSSSGNSNDFSDNEGVTLTSGLLQKLLSSGAFSNSVTQIVNNEFAGYIGKSITVNELNAKMIMATDIVGENGFFEYLQSKLISADRIVSNSAEFKELLAKVAEIDSLVAGEITVDRITGTTGEFDTFFVNNFNVNNVLGTNAAFKTLVAGEITSDVVISRLVDATEGQFDSFTADIGFVQKLDSLLITSDKIVTSILEADDARIRELATSLINTTTINADIGNIKNLLAGNAGVGDLQVINLTADNAIMSEAFIKDMIAAKISVADLMAHSATAELITLISADGKPSIAFQNSTQQFYDSTGAVRVQIGQDGNGEFNFVIRGTDGTTTIFDSTGIKKEGIPDGTIINDMIENATIDKTKLNFPIVETDENGKVSITEILDGSGQSFGITYQEFQETTNTSISDINGEITTVRNTLDGVSSQVDKNTQSITDRVWSSDIDTKIDSYDSTTVKEIRDRVTTTETDIDGITSTVSDLSSTLETKADGTTVQALTERVSTAEQTAAGFQQEVTSHFQTTDGNVSSLQTQFSQLDDKFYWLVKSDSTQSSLTLTDSMLQAITDQFVITSPDGTSTIISGGKITTGSITTNMLASDAIKSTNYIANTQDSHFSILGTFLDLNNGAIYTPNFGIDGLNNAYFSGNVMMTSGRIGEDDANSWHIGTVYNQNLEPSAAMIANGDAYIWAGNWTFGVDKINTYNNGGYINYSNTYYDMGMMSPIFDTTSVDYINSKVSDNFLYIRQHSETIPVNENDWTYLFRVTKDGTIYENGVKLSDKYASVDGISGIYLPLTGGTISNNLIVNGDLTVNGSITGIASRANQLTHILSVNGRGWDGSTDLTVGTIDVGYGGTGRTSWTQYGIVYATSASTLGQLSVGTSGQILKSNGSAAPTWVAQSELDVGSATKAIQDASGNVITSTYMPLSGGTFVGEVTFNDGVYLNDTTYVDDIQIGSMLVTGSARFVNGLIGNLSGKSTSADKLSTTVDITIGNTKKSTDLSSALSYTLAEIGALGASDNAASASKLASAVTINGVSFDGTSNISVTANPTSTALTSQDLDNITTPGSYYAAGGNTVVNKPSGINAFGLHVFKTAGSYTTQILVQDNNKIWQRQYTGTWSSWSYIYSEFFKPTKSDIGLGNVDNTADSVKNVLSATMWTTARKIGNATVDGTADITLEEMGASASGHTHSDYATSLTLNGTAYNVSSNNITVTRDNLMAAIGAASGSANGYMSKEDKSKLDSINISDIGTVVASSIRGSGVISADIVDGIATISHNDSGVTAGTYGASSTNYFRIPNFTVDANGHITTAGYNDITGANLVSRIGTNRVTNATNATNATSATKSYLLANLYTSTTRPTDANITATGSGGIATFKATSNMTYNKPDGDSHILHMYWDNTLGFDSQLAISNCNRNAAIQYRSQVDGDWQAWRTVLDTVNYNTYVPKIDGTGASGTWGISIAGNAATATKATQDSEGQAINTTYIKGLSNSGSVVTYTKGDGTTGTITLPNCLPLSGGTITGTLAVNGATTLNSTLNVTGITTLSERINSSVYTNTYLSGNQGKAIINSTAGAGLFTMLAKMNSTNGYFTHGVYQTSYNLYYTEKSVVDAETNTVTKTLRLLNEDGNSTFPGNITASDFIGKITGTSGTFSSTLAVTGTSTFTGKTTHNGGIQTGLLQVKMATSGSNDYGSSNPRIRFENSGGTQNVDFIFTDYDSVRYPAGVSLRGNQGGEYFDVPNLHAEKVHVGGGCTLEMDSYGALNFVFA